MKVGVSTVLAVFIAIVALFAVRLWWYTSASLAGAVARVEPTRGHLASGTVTFTARGDELEIEARLSGLQQGMHGFHVHETGDRSGPDGSTAGGHFGVIGHSVVLHSGSDDLNSQPSGDSGARVACGVIVAAPGPT